MDTILMNDTLKAIQAIHKTQKRIATLAGITMGILMSIYFFTFAALIDRGMFGVLVFEMITSIAFVFAFIFIHPLSFRLTRLFYGRNHAALLQQLMPADIHKTPEQVYQLTRTRLQQQAAQQ